MFRVYVTMVLGLYFMTAPTVSAGVIVGFDFDDGTCQPSTLASDITSTDFQAGDGLRCIMIAGQMIGWGFGGTPANDFWSFTVSAAPGSVLDLGSIEIRERRFFFGPQVFQWQIDGYALDSTKRTTLFAATNRILDLNVAALQDLTSATLRLIAWGAPSESRFSGWIVDDVVLRGDIQFIGGGTNSPVHTPEPASIAAWAAVIVAVFGVSSLRRRQIFSWARH
jgi:hypothetical protein